MDREPTALSEYALAILGELAHTLRRRTGLSLFVLFVAVALLVSLSRWRGYCTARSERCLRISHAIS